MNAAIPNRIGPQRCLSRRSTRTLVRFRRSSRDMRLQVCLILGLIPSLLAQQQGQVPRAQAAGKSGRAGAAIDLTGYWVAVIDEDWRWRMLTPEKGDFSSVPLNIEGRRVADLWDPGKDESAGLQCKVYGAPSLMRLPTRLHITWADENTLKIETDL